MPGTGRRGERNPPAELSRPATRRRRLTTAAVAARLKQGELGRRIMDGWWALHVGDEGGGAQPDAQELPSADHRGPGRGGGPVCRRPQPASQAKPKMATSWTTPKNHRAWIDAQAHHPQAAEQAADDRGPEAGVLATRPISLW